jgi:VRR-NUC domain.
MKDVSLDAIELIRRSTTEKEFQQSIINVAHLLGWKVYHTWSSIRSVAGFPDLVLVRRDRLIFAEVKTENGKVTKAQQEWLDNLQHVAEVYVFRPRDWTNVVDILGKKNSPSGNNR